MQRLLSKKEISITNKKTRLFKKSDKRVSFHISNTHVHLKQDQRSCEHLQFPSFLLWSFSSSTLFTDIICLITVAYAVCSELIARHVNHVCVSAARPNLTRSSESHDRAWRVLMSKRERKTEHVLRFSSMHINYANSQASSLGTLVQLLVNANLISQSPGSNIRMRKKELKWLWMQRGCWCQTGWRRS